MILIVTSKTDITSDFVINRLIQRQVKYYRFNTEDISHNTSINVDPINNDCSFIFDKHKHHKFYLNDFKSIYYRRPLVPRKFDNINEKHVNFAIMESMQALKCLLNFINCFWVSNPYKLVLAEDKISQLRIAKQLGFAVSPTLLSNEPQVIKSFIDENNRNVVIKPIRSGLVDRNNVVFTQYVTAKNISDDQVASLPSIYQVYVPKQYDIRVTVIGNQLFAMEIHSQDHQSSRIDWRQGQIVNMKQCRHNLPESIKSLCLSLVRHYGLEFGAIDLILTPDGNYFFLEINPNGQWAWVENRTGYKMTDTLIDLLLKGKPSA